MLNRLASHKFVKACLHTPAVSVLCWVLLPSLVLVAIACTSPAPRPAPDKAKAAAPEKLAVKVITRKEGKTTTFLVDNRELCEITMTFEMGLKNLKPSVSLPYTASFPPGVTEAYSVTPEDENAKWTYTYTNHFKLGGNCVRHDDNVVYELPYSAGAKFEVTQGYNGKFSHKGSNQYATDWQMPRGTVVCAARGGLVVRTKDDSDKGGGDISYDHFNNYVLIRHEDGTLGHYCHLQKGGVMVKPGDTVVAGQPIAHSGSTGFSTGPHLHFCVFMAKSGTQRVSVPVKFRTSRDAAVTLTEGHTYQAVAVSIAVAKVPAAAQPVATAASGAAAQ